MRTLLVILMITLVGVVAHAKKVKVENIEERNTYIKKGITWIGAPWISDDLRFSDGLDVYNGPPMRGELARIYKKNEVFCKTSQDLLDSATSGKTEKFFCQLLEYNDLTPVYEDDGDIEKIKVKYGENNGEVYAEVITTRLLWALGFPVDAVYHYDRTYCFGCPKNPFKQRYLDDTTLEEARLFSNTAIEQKFRGDEIIFTGKQPRNRRIRGRRGLSAIERVPKVHEEGWSFKELNSLLSDDTETRKLQRTHRDAFRLLLSMVSHADSKAANHRIVCEKGMINESGKCTGEVYLIAQDLGVAFGSLDYLSIVTDTVSGSNPLSRVDFGRWQEQEVWQSVIKCQPRVGFHIGGAGFNDPISEDGKNFLYRLLHNFSYGDKGRKRLIDVFQSGRVELRSANAEEWADAFIRKVEEIQLAQSCPKAR